MLLLLELLFEERFFRQIKSKLMIILFLNTTFVLCHFLELMQDIKHNGR